MKNRLCLFVLLYSISVCLAACGEKECIIKMATKKQRGELQTIKNRCKDNIIISEQELSRTPEGNLIANGYYKEYFDNGKLHAIAFFKNNKQDSIAIKYYENGNKELEFYWENGIQIGFQSVYNKNGKYLRRDYFLRDSVKMFLVKYDGNDHIEHLEGPLFHISYDKDVDNLLLGEKLFITNEIVQLDNLESNLTVKLYSPSKRKIIDTVMSSFRKFGNRYYFLKLLNLSEHGKYTYNAHLKLIDKANNRILKEDSTSFAITVK